MFFSIRKTVFFKIVKQQQNYGYGYGSTTHPQGSGERARQRRPNSEREGPFGVIPLSQLTLWRGQGSSGGRKRGPRRYNRISDADPRPNRWVWSCNGLQREHWHPRESTSTMKKNATTRMHKRSLPWYLSAAVLTRMVLRSPLRRLS